MKERRNGFMREFLKMGHQCWELEWVIWAVIKGLRGDAAEYSTWWVFECKENKRTGNTITERRTNSVKLVEYPLRKKNQKIPINFPCLIFSLLTASPKKKLSKWFKSNSSKWFKSNSYSKSLRMRRKKKQTAQIS